MAYLLASSELRDAVARRVSAMVPCPVCLPDEVMLALEGKTRPTPASCFKHHQDAACLNTCVECNGTGVQDARRLWEAIRKAPVPGELAELLDGRLPRIWLEDETLMEQAKGGADELFLRDLHHCTLEPIADLTAQALFIQSRSFQLKPVTIEGGAWSEAGYKPEVDRYLRQRDGEVINKDSPRWTVAERVAALPGRWVESGNKPEWADHSGMGEGKGHAQWQNPRWDAADMVALLPGPAGVSIGITRMDALTFVRGLELTSSDVLIVDSPYAGTSGYAHDSPRGDVLEICEIGHRAGALVICHEGVGLAKELGPGWEERSASPLRSRASSFHAGGIEREWISFNRPIQWWPAKQSSMFALAPARVPRRTGSKSIE
jgi:hypothetical protein